MIKNKIILAIIILTVVMISSCGENKNAVIETSKYETTKVSTTIKEVITTISEIEIVEAVENFKPEVAILLNGEEILYNDNSFYEIDNENYSVSFTSNINPLKAEITIYNNKKELIEKEDLLSNDLPAFSNDGVFNYILKLTYEDKSYSYIFRVKVDVKAEIIIDKSEFYQGDILNIKVLNANEDEIPVIEQGINDSFILYKTDNDYEGMITAGYYTDPGEYTIKYGFEGQELIEKKIKVIEYPFDTQYLTIDVNVAASTKNNESSAEYAKYFKPSRYQSNEERYYTESFVIPTYGELTTEYGMNRYTNGVKTWYHHSGLDIGDEFGYPIVATNRGKVVLSMYLIMTGNTIVIDHGQGLFSVYFHMQKRLVEEGAIVEREQQIGEMGSTGFSTGPHLHFTMSYFSTNLEPGYFLVGEPLTKANWEKYLMKK